MAITFENDNDVIVYALEKIISYARNNQYILVAQCVWWLASIIGLQQGLVIYIDTLDKQSAIRLQGSSNNRVPSVIATSEHGTQETSVTP